MGPIRRIMKPVINRDEVATIEEETKELSSIDSPINYFAINFYNKLIKKQDNRNILFSPFSISTCFSMAYHGAKGETADEMKNVFQFPNTQDTPDIFSKVIKDIRNRGNKAPNEINIANSLFIQKNYPIKEDYLRVIKNYYSTELFSVDFVKEGNLSANLINKWVKEQTKGKITEIIGKPVDSLLRMAILNAIYFYGKWEKQFNKKNTKDGTFYTDIGLEKSSVAFMYAKDEFLYTEGKGYQMLGMNHDNRETMMVFVLPKIEYRMFDIETDLVNGTLIRNINNMYEREVRVTIPRFKIETEYDLGDYLCNMGMLLAFSSGADFSGINEELHIGKAKHKAYIEVNEKGSEAAAATMVQFFKCASSIKELVFKADHPFIFLIVDKKVWKNILFIGKIVNPKQ